MTIQLGVPAAPEDLRPTVTQPADETALVRGASVVFAWTALPGVSQYGLEFTGADRQFANPNGTAADPVNGFGGPGGGFLVTGTSVTVGIPQTLAPGRYQVRVVGFGASGIVGSFSDAVTVVVQ